MRKPVIDSAAFLLVAILAYTIGVHVPANARAAAPVNPGSDIVACKALADRAGVSVAGAMSVQAADALTLQALRDHGLVAPFLKADGNQITLVDGYYHRVQVARVTEADIQAAADEVKPCFPAQ